MNHEELKEMLALEALGALPEAERRPPAEHLASCEECRRELDELREAAALLAYAAEPAAPPADLRERVIESVRAEAAETPASVSAGALGDEVLVGKNAGAVAARGRASRDEVRRVLRQLGPWDMLRARPALGFGFAGAVLLAVVLGVTAAVFWNRTRDLRAEVARLAARLTDAEAETARGRVVLAQTREVNDLLTAPDSRFERLTGTKAAPRAAARVAYDRETRRAVLVASGLPPAPAGKAYQLWFMSGGKPIPGGVLPPGPGGRALLNDTAPAGIGEVSGFAVTLEDEGGVVSPQGEVYLLSSAS